MSDEKCLLKNHLSLCSVYIQSLYNNVTLLQFSNLQSFNLFLRSGIFGWA